MLTLGYSTYGLQDQDPFEAVRRLADIGYDTVEFTASDGWPTVHDAFDDGDRAEMAALLDEVDFPSPDLMDLQVSPRARGEERTETRDRLDATCEMAAALAQGDRTPVVKTVVGGQIDDWDAELESFGADLLELADVAGAHDVTFAVEPHVGSALDDPAEADELMRSVEHPHLGLALDIAHFPPPRFDTDRVVELCGPHAVTTHFEDTEIVDGEIVYHPGGTTDFDYEDYCTGLVEVGYDGPFTAEVASAIWDTDEYDPWETARVVYDNVRPAVAAANERAD
jgi:sugar phosphate isomerase/epimerase